MKSILNQLLTTVLLLHVFLLPLLTQEKDIRFQHITIENGLPQNMVDCILQDNKGFMWFGTWNGLCRFDGYSFKTFRSQTQNTSTVSNNFIYSLCEDHNGNIWIGTNKGVNLYIYNKDSFITFGNDSIFSKLHDVPINSIICSQDSIIWIGSNKGLIKVTINNLSEVVKHQYYNHGNDSHEISGSRINHLMIDRRNTLWISTNNGLNYKLANSEIFQRINHDPLNPNSIPLNSVRCAYEDTDGFIWIGTESGVSKFNRNSNIFTNYTYDPEQPNSLVHNSIMSITEDVKGRIIIGTLGGISIYKKDGAEKFINYTQNLLSESDLNNSFINCVYSDRWGNIWIGTERGGINKFNSAKREFEYFESKAGTENTLNNNTVNSIYEDKEYIWIGTAGGGLNRYSKTTGNYKHYLASPNNAGAISSNFITAIVRDANKDLWIGTWGGGINKLINEGKPNERFLNYRPQDGGNNIVSDYISSLIPEPNGEIWVGTLGGLDKFQPENNTFIHINNLVADSDDLLAIGCLVKDEENNLWLGTRNGLMKLIISNKETESEKYILKKFYHDEQRINSLSGNYVISLFKDSENYIWAGTYGFGLNKLISEKDGGSFTSYSQKEGLPNDIIYTITEDLTGNLWLTTDYGLSRFNKKENVFRNYFIADGLQNNQYYWSAAFINHSGKLYFGGMNGMNAFYPDWISENTTKSQVVFTDFSIFNRTVVPGKKYNGKIAITKSVNTSQEIELSYKSREFSFEFSALDYEQPSANQYAYMLKGFDNEWNIVGSGRRFANYTNLKPGRYVFMVKATDSHGEWFDNVREIKIIISPPFWDTWWFKIVLFILFVSTLITYNRYRVYSLRIQKRKLEEQVNERTTEIEKQNQILEDKNIQLANRQELIEGQKKKLESQNDKLIDLNKRVKQINQLKLRFFTNISHEFRTPLTLILAPLEKLIIQSESFDTDTQQSISIIQRNAQRLLHLINQLMDFRKLEQGKMKINVSEVNLTEFLQNIKESFGALAEKKNIRLMLYIEENIPTAWFDFQKIENVLYNLLSNAFKNTPEKGEIWIRLKKSDPKNNDFSESMESEHLIIEVGDTGYGIDEESLLHIFDRFYQIDSDTASGRPMGTGIGLSLAKEFIKKHKGKIRVTSQPGEGTSFFIHLPYKQESYPSDIQSNKKYDPNTIKQQTNTLVNNLQPALNIKKKEIKKVKGRPVIQITEDNSDLREFLTNKLEENYNVIEAENGRIGYELATLHNPDIIISDIMMPEMDGLEMCTKIKTNLVTSHIPVILLTAKGTIENQIEGLETGAEIYLPKPFDLEILNAHITNLIESRRKLYEAFQVNDKINSSEVSNTSLDDKFMVSLLNIIDKNIENPNLNVNLLLKELSISRSLLHRKITSITNMSTVEFITNIRLKKSIEMLKDSDKNISDVAYALGFNDPKYFSRIFRKQFGKSPSDYQKSMEKTN